MNKEEVLEQIALFGKQGFKHYVYALQSTAGEIFYVGKGTGTRCVHHGHKDKNNQDKCKIIEDLKSNGSPHEIEILSYHKSQDEAYRKEKDIINELGRECDGGILSNKSKGGYGGWPYITEETRKKMSIAQTGKKQSKEQIRKRVESSQEFFKSDYYRQKCSEGSIRRWAREGERDRARERMKQIRIDNKDSWSKATYLKQNILEINNKIYVGNIAAGKAFNVARNTISKWISQGKARKLGTVETHSHLLPNSKIKPRRTFNMHI